jgi:hypothetical protein
MRSCPQSPGLEKPAWHGKWNQPHSRRRARNLQGHDGGEGRLRQPSAFPRLSINTQDGKRRTEWVLILSAGNLAWLVHNDGGAADKAPSNPQPKRPWTLHPLQTMI